MSTSGDHSIQVQLDSGSNRLGSMPTSGDDRMQFLITSGNNLLDSMPTSVDHSSLSLCNSWSNLLGYMSTSGTIAHNYCSLLGAIYWALCLGTIAYYFF
ncbi:hypothetical protein DPMN_054454 [Dreissena polymorpha]|uniref:Uncharacterized protein n=1 Tax=Dreissena polymorpha TaxID=45954 RepID=A0A9D4CPW7_DREPO|nr:hypothetical protein DPMN_054454 [Dreissena polymorpha]